MVGGFIFGGGTSSYFFLMTSELPVKVAPVAVGIISFFGMGFGGEGSGIFFLISGSFSTFLVFFGGGGGAFFFFGSIFRAGDF